MTARSAFPAPSAPGRRGEDLRGEVMVVTDGGQAHRCLTDVVGAAIDGGARWVLLREKHLPAVERARLAEQLRALLTAVDGTLSVAGPDPLGSEAVHLSAADPHPASELGLVGRSCHGLDELQRLSIEDYVTLSPVFASRSKPGYGPPLMPDGLRELIQRAPVPVIALGGVESPAAAIECVRAGATGVAVMGAVMRSAEPARLVARLRAAVDAALAERHGR